MPPLLLRTRTGQHAPPQAEPKGAEAARARAPSDEVEKLDTDKAARIARMVFYIANDVANDPQRPRWDPKGLEEVRRLTR